MRHALRVFVGLVIFFSVSGCKKAPGSPSPLPPPPVPALFLTCPADMRIEDVTTPTQAVTFSTSRTGGLEPVTVSCAPSSDTAFALGTTIVNCSATDAGTPAANAVCSFGVTLVAYVPPVPDLSLTRFMAFGDSITKGEIGDVKGGPGPCDPGPAFTSHSLRPQYLSSEQAYPSVVHRLLTQRYARQTFTMANEGSGGETAHRGYTRFSDAVASHRPEAVLLLQGILDVRDHYDDPTAPIEALQTDIRNAQAQGVAAVFISTLLPFGDGIWGCGALNGTVRAANDLIRNLAASEGAVLVDPYPAFAANLGTLQGADGLHPTAAGQEVIGQAFFDAIKRTLESPATSGVSSALPRPQIQIGSPAYRQPIRIPNRQQ